ncbi:MAG: helix-turn-helix domain-containing protein [Thermoanaerobaculia bacterium]
MTTNDPLGDLLRIARESRGWSFGGLAEAIGMRRAKAWKLADLERGGFDRKLLDRIAPVLELDPAALQHALDELERRWAEEEQRARETADRQWVADWKGPFYCWKAMAGVGVTEYAPVDLTTEQEIEAWAVSRKKREGVVYTSLWRRSFIREFEVTSRESFEPATSSHYETRIGNQSITSMFTIERKSS